MNDCILVCRVSSPDQTTGYSLDAQERLGLIYIEKNKLNLIQKFIFQESASKINDQKKFNEIMSFVSKYVERNKNPLAIIVEKKDRWGRIHSRKELIQLHVMTGKVVVHYFREKQIFDKSCSPEDIFMEDVVTSMNKYQALNIGREAKKGMLEKARQGWFPSKPPIGYLNNPNRESNEAIIVCEQEKKLIIRIFELRAEQNLSYSLIARAVKIEGLVPAKRYESFRKSTVEKILKNKFYDGIITFCAEEFEGLHELFVPESYRKKVYNLFKKPGIMAKRKHEGIYADLLNCGECGCKVTFHSKKKPSGRIYHLYSCTNGKKFHQSLKGMYLNEETITSKFEMLLDELVLTESQAQKIAEALNDNHIKLKSRLRREETKLKNSIANLEAREDELYEDHKRGLFDEDTYKRRINNARRERDEISNLLIENQKSVNEIYLKTAKDILELAKNAKLYWNHLSNSEKVHLLKKLLWNPTITNATIEYEIKKPFKILLEMKGFSQNEKWGG